MARPAAILALWVVGVAGWCRRDGPANGPCVDRVFPKSGSLAGGTLVSIYGKNLLPEHPTSPLTPSAVVTIGGTPCDLQRVMSSSTKLVCKTRAYLGAGSQTASELLAGVAPWEPGWRDRGCEPGRQPVSVVVLDVGGDITGAWNSG